jgi:hypothetical protein
MRRNSNKYNHEEPNSKVVHHSEGERFDSNLQFYKSKDLIKYLIANKGFMLLL